MSGKPKISPNNTYVIDEDLLSEMDDIELTGMVRELTDQMNELDYPDEPPADETEGGDQSQDAEE